MVSYKYEIQILVKSVGFVLGVLIIGGVYFWADSQLPATLTGAVLWLGWAITLILAAIIVYLFKWLLFDWGNPVYLDVAILVMATFLGGLDATMLSFLL